MQPFQFHKNMCTPQEYQGLFKGVFVHSTGRTQHLLLG